MSTKVINCPNCGGNVEFRPSAYLPGVCTHCGASIAPPKAQSAESHTKLDAENKPVNVPRLAPVKLKEKKGLSLSRIVIGVVVLAVVGGFYSWQKQRALAQYWNIWESKITDIPCNPNSSNPGSSSNVRLIFGSFRDTSFLHPASPTSNKAFSGCLSESVELMRVTTEDSYDLIYGSLKLLAHADGSKKIVADSLSLSRISPQWRLDVYREREKRPEIEAILSDADHRANEMWSCWVNFGVLMRPGNLPFNKYTGQTVNVPIRLSIDAEGQVTQASVVRHKSKSQATTWEDQHDFSQCLKEGAQELGAWPPAADSESYQVTFMLDVHRKDWE
jgi:hypothetical protein